MTLPSTQLRGLAVAVAAVAISGGCAAQGRRLEAWTLSVEGGPRDVPVTLPGSLGRWLPRGEASYMLRTTVTLTAAERGRPVALLIDCFHERIDLSVDGKSVADVGDPRVRSHRFLLDPPLTDGATMQLTLSLRRDFESAPGFGVAPRLSDRSAGDRRHRAIGFLNRHTAIAELCFAFFIAFLYGSLFLLDRRRRENAAVAVQAICAAVVAVYPLGLFGILATPTYLAANCILAVALLYFLHLTFALGPVPRWWSAAFIAMAIASLAGTGSMLTLSLVSIPMTLACHATYGYLIVRLVLLIRAGDQGRNAGLILAAAVFTELALVPDIIWLISGGHPLGGAHIIGLGVLSFAAAQSLVLTRQHVARQRALEQTADDLRREVADRSRQLADALARLSLPTGDAIVPGATIDGRYRVIAELGAGGMGRVYSVERLADGRQLALKVLRGRVQHEQMARFAREAQIAAGLHHPNLVSVLDLGVTSGGTLFLVMELVNGTTLQDERRRFGEAEWALPILAQIATGLSAMHERGIIHRDLKPANVLLARGVARIADFGLACLRGDSSEDSANDSTAVSLDSPSLTRAGMVFGTPYYMAPELAGGVREVRPAADVWSFGVIACELITGRAPFAEAPLVALMHNRPIAPIQRLAAEGLRPDVRETIERCLLLDPDERPSAAQLHAAFG